MKMTNILANEWDKYRKYFEEYDSSGWVLWDFLKVIFEEKKITFPALLKKAEDGEGFSVLEKFICDLDSEIDSPEEKGNVIFVFGEMDIFLPVSSYLHLIGVASDFYIKHHPEDKQSIMDSLKKINERMSKFVPPSA